MFVFLRLFAARRAVLSAIVSGTRDEEGIQLGSRLVVSNNNARRCDIRESDLSLPFPLSGHPLVISLRKTVSVQGAVFTRIRGPRHSIAQENWLWSMSEVRRQPRLLRLCSLLTCSLAGE
jgi:hypothetical protein